jgi:polysaccharide export outer membrane protein
VPATPAPARRATATSQRTGCASGRGIGSIIALLLAACSSPIPDRIEGPLPAAWTAPVEEYPLGANDVLRINVYDHPELSSPVTDRIAGTRIDPSGEVSLPLVGSLHVAGMTVPEARAAITAAFAQYVQEPKVDVSLVEYTSRRFYLYGEIEEPGPYVLDRPMSVYEGLTLGGGLQRGAKRGEVLVLRVIPEGLEVHKIDAERPELAGLMPLHPEDFVFVRRSKVGKFTDEVLPILTGISSALGSIATIILIEDRLEEN